MDWFGEEEIQSKLKDIPKFKMSEWSAEQIKLNVTNVPVKPQKSRQGITILKSVGVALSGAAVAAVVLTNLPSQHLPNAHLTTGAGNSSSPTANTKSSTQSETSANTVSTPYSYFGMAASLKPMVPAALTQGYQVKASELYIYNRDPSSTYFRGDRYDSLYVDSKSQAQIEVSEVNGNSISDATYGANAMTVAWQSTKQIGGQTYYIHTPSARDGLKSNIVGFVRDGVVYQFASMQLSIDAMLTVAQSKLQPAPVNVVDRYAGETYDLAVNNITFKPLMLPNSYSSKWKLHAMGSTVAKTSNQSGYQEVSMDYQLPNGTQPFSILEVPLGDASQTGLGEPIYSATKTWKDDKHGLEIEVSGNISQAELDKIVSALQASN